MTELYIVCRQRGGPSRVTSLFFRSTVVTHCLLFTVEVG
jgi:hypothetical protein